MKPLFVPIVLFVFICSSSLFARVGDTEKEISKRLKHKGKAEVYDEKHFPGKMNGNPYSKLKRLLLHPELGADFQTEMYWKPVDPREEKAPELLPAIMSKGWDFHVIYYKGVSVIEYYKRNDASINNYEKEAILRLNSPSSKWVDKSSSSLLNANLAQAKGDYRAFTEGPHLLVFDKRVESVVKSLMEKLRKEESGLHKESFRTSVEGF